MPGIDQLVAASGMIPRWGWILLAGVLVFAALDSENSAQAISSVGGLLADLSVRVQLLAGSVGIGFFLGMTVPPGSLPVVGGFL